MNLKADPCGCEWANDTLVVVCEGHAPAPSCTQCRLSADEGHMPGCPEASPLRPEDRDLLAGSYAPLEQVEALEARCRAGIRAAVAALHAAHLALPDGESVPREFVDAAMLGVEAHLFAAMRGES